MVDLWSPNIRTGEMSCKRIDVTEVDEIYVESEGYVYIEGGD